MAKHYGDIPCVKIAEAIHITTSGTTCLCGTKYKYATLGRNGESSTNIIWRELESVSCQKCKNLFKKLNFEKGGKRCVRINIEFGLLTDGDFSLRNIEYFEKAFKENEDFDYYGNVFFDSKDYPDSTYCMFAAREFVERLLTDIHVSYTHYYILEDIYQMMQPVIEFVNACKEGIIEKSISGNYSGTFVKVTIQRGKNINNS